MLTAHEALVAKLVRTAHAKTSGFRKSVEQALEIPGELMWFTLIPDAYTIAHRHVTIYEVEDTHRVNADKLECYAQLWGQLHTMDVEVQLKILDIRGGVYEPDLAHVYFSR